MKPLLVIHLDDLIGLGIVAAAGLFLLGAWVFIRVSGWWEKRTQRKKGAK